MQKQEWISKPISILLGQSDVKTTIKVYNHVDMERTKRELARVEKWEKIMPMVTPNLHQFAVII